MQVVASPAINHVKIFVHGFKPIRQPRRGQGSWAKMSAFGRRATNLFPHLFSLILRPICVSQGRESFQEVKEFK
jgi:hypothetical protein